MNRELIAELIAELEYHLIALDQYNPALASSVRRAAAALRAQEWQTAAEVERLRDSLETIRMANSFEDGAAEMLQAIARAALVETAKDG